MVIDRGMEFSEKLKTMAISGNQLIQNLYKLKSIDLTLGYGIMMISYPNRAIHKELITRLASHLTELSMLKEQKNPDYFGKSLVIIGNDVFALLMLMITMYFEAIFRNIYRMPFCIRKFKEDN